VAPGLEELEELWVPWAAAVYEAWMPLDWDKHPTDLADAHEPPFGSAPWTGTTDSKLAAAVPRPADPWQGRPVASSRGRLTVVPADARAGAWSGLFAASGDFAIAACFERTPWDSVDVLTHVAVTLHSASTAPWPHPPQGE